MDESAMLLELQLQSRRMERLERDNDVEDKGGWHERRNEMRTSREKYNPTGRCLSEATIQLHGYNVEDGDDSTICIQLRFLLLHMLFKRRKVCFLTLPDSHLDFGSSANLTQRPATYHH